MEVAYCTTVYFQAIVLMSLIMLIGTHLEFRHKESTEKPLTDERKLLVANSAH